MSKRTLFLIFALFIITFVLLMVALYKPQAPKTLQVVTAPKEPAAQTDLSFGSLSASASSSIPINIATGKNKVTAVQLELQYDPQVLTNVSITPGSFFKNPVILLNQIDAKTGRISYALGINPTDQGVVGQGVVANISFSAKTKTSEETAIIFLPKTLVTAEGVSETVLKTSKNAIFTVGATPTITQ